MEKEKNNRQELDLEQLAKVSGGNEIHDRPTMNVSWTCPNCGAKICAPRPSLGRLIKEHECIPSAL